MASVTFLCGGAPWTRLIKILGTSSPLVCSTNGPIAKDPLLWSIRKGEIVIRKRTEVLAKFRAREVSQVALFGGVEVTTPAVRELIKRGIPVLWFSTGGWFYGMAGGHWHRNILLRTAQYAAAADEARALSIAREIVRSKIRNQRTLLRRNTNADGATLDELRRLSKLARGANARDALMGLEGSAAKLYFRGLAASFVEAGEAFDFTHRNRRPPTDPINAMLSYAYAILTSDATVALMSAGFDPYRGLFHQPRYGRASLALDLMEEFRPLIVDSVVLMAVRNGEVSEASFVKRAHGCALTTSGKRSFLRCYERRMRQEITHPIFGYRVSWRRMIEVQARLLGRHVLGEIPRYVPIETR